MLRNGNLAFVALLVAESLAAHGPKASLYDRLQFTAQTVRLGVVFIP